MPEARAPLAAPAAGGRPLGQRPRAGVRGGALRSLFGAGLVALALIGAGLTSGPAEARAVPDPQSIEMGARLTRLEAALATPEGRDRSAADLIAAADLAALVTPEAAPRRPVEPPAPPPGATEVQRLNMRLALTMLSQAYGAEDTGAVLAAQTAPGMEALVIRKGRVTLAELGRILQQQGLQRAGPDPGRGLTLTVPLVIWDGASLLLRPGDALHLSRADGAFIVNFGHLDVQGATIATTGEPNPASRSFIPFVTTADGGTVQMTEGRILGLGFGATLKFSGFAIMRNALRVTGRASWVENSLFDGVLTVSVSAARDMYLAGNRFRDMRGPALVVSRSRGVQVLSNLFSGGMPTNAIRLEEGSAQGRITGNVVLGGDRAGIVVRNGSTGAVVSHNIVWHRAGSGITLAKSDCGRLHDNLVIDNAQKGIEVRASRGAELRANTVLSNRSAGLWVSAQPGGTETRLNGNVLAANGSGLASAVGESLRLEGNDFSRQFPQFLSGDLALQSRIIARDLQGRAPLVLTAAGLEPDAGAVAAAVCAD
jgi:poly(beta-D-mannuronate) C5 epimerase